MDEGKMKRVGMARAGIDTRMKITRERGKGNNGDEHNIILIMNDG